MRDWSSHAASGAKRPAATARPRREPWPSSTRRRGGSLDAEASHLRPPHAPNHYHWSRTVMIGSNRPFALVLAMTAVLTPLSATPQHTQHKPEARRAGKEWVRTGRSRGTPYH